MEKKLVSESSLSTTRSTVTSKSKKIIDMWNGREFYAEILGTFILMVLNNGIVATYTLRKKGPLDVLAQSYIAGQCSLIQTILSLSCSVSLSI